MLCSRFSVTLFTFTVQFRLNNLLVGRVWWNGFDPSKFNITATLSAALFLFMQKIFAFYDHTDQLNLVSVDNLFTEDTQ